MAVVCFKLCVLFSAQALQDPGVYGVIQSGDHKGRTCVVKWIKLNPSSDDVEVSKKTGRKCLCDTAKKKNILLHVIDDV